MTSVNRIWGKFKQQKFRRNLLLLILLAVISSLYTNCIGSKFKSNSFLHPFEDSSSASQSNQVNGDVNSTPLISKVSISEITSTSAVVTWDLDQCGSGQVEYGTVSRSLTLKSAYQAPCNYSSHRQTLSGLTANTQYFFRVVSANVSGKQSISQEESFTTLAVNTPTIPSQPLSPPPNNNGIWMYRKDLNEAALKTLVEKQIFNVYLEVGYPNAKDDPSLFGIVPESEIGILVTKEQVRDALAMLARVDHRLRLWAWFGTWSTLGTSDAHGHELAKVDISSASNRAALIRNIVKVASWGFYGVQDDTEDLTENSLTPAGQGGAALVSFWNEEARALRAVGIKLATFTPAVWYNFNEEFVAQITEPDFHVMVPNDGMGEQQWLELSRQFLGKSKIPVILDAGGRGFCPQFTRRTDLLPLSSYPQIVGYAFWEYADWSQGWSCWDAWHK